MAYYSDFDCANMNSLPDIKSMILCLMLFACFFSIQSQTVVPRTGHKLNESSGKYCFSYIFDVYCLVNIDKLFHMIFLHYIFTFHTIIVWKMTKYSNIFRLVIKKKLLIFLMSEILQFLYTPINMFD